MVVSDELLIELQNEIETVLDDYNYDYSYTSIADIIDEWRGQKQPLIDLFSKHPKWNPDKLMIQFDEDYTREIDVKAVWAFSNWFWKTSREQGDICYSKRDYVYDFIRQIRSEFLSSIDRYWLDKINETNDAYHIRSNMKSCKAIGKIFREEGWDKLLEDYNKEYAKLCDALSPIKVTRHTCISVNPVDFLLMSNGNSWDSCHSIEKDSDGDAGCYSSGTISYMLDGTSFLFYTVSSEYDGEYIEQEPKICRQVFCYKDEEVFQSRLYPQSNDSGSDHIYENYRNIVQKVISECLEAPNLWVKVSNIERARQYLRHGKGATCYPDFKYYSTVSLSYLKDRERELDVINIGAPPICIECGDIHDYKESISCCQGNKWICEECGCVMTNEDDVIWIDGNSYCGDCTDQCDECYCGMLRDDYVQVHVLDWQGCYSIRFWCDDCTDRYATRCHCCGEYWYDKDIENTEDGFPYCPVCLDDNTFICNKCGLRYSLDQMNDKDGHSLCNECYEEVCNKEEDDENEDNVA